MASDPFRAPKIRRFPLTFGVGLFLAPLMILSYRLPYPLGPAGEWSSTIVVIGLMLLAIVFGVLAPSRGGALAAIMAIPLVVAAECGRLGPHCGGELGFPFMVFVFWWILMLPALMGLVLGLFLGVRWDGRRLVHHWSRPAVTTVVALRGE